MKDPVVKKNIKITGIVQGVGFRPFVHKIAEKYDIKGFVINRGPFVEVRAEGRKEDVELFLRAIKTDAPDRAKILQIDIEDDRSNECFESFEIRESSGRAGDDIIFIPPDIGICEDCKRELYDKNDRRYRHPLINCTACGPRLTIIDSLPYDRERTSMKDFKMCPSCKAEYEDIRSRRYDAQPVCCPDCGPKYTALKTIDISSFQGISASRPTLGADFKDDIRSARKTIISGGIIALKGIGGCHFCCSAYSKEAIARLRNIKVRPMKPFALMMKDIEAVKKHCVLDREQEEFLKGPIRPIVLLEKKDDCNISDLVAPKNDRLGVMLPYAPVQLLLFRMDDALDEKMPDAFVMTSVNISGEPIIKDDDELIKKFGESVELILSNDREILTRADDSVTDFFEKKPYLIRRSRGLSPLPVSFPQATDCNVLAFGGELKNSFCVGKNDLFYPSPYIGDMGYLRTNEVQAEEIERFLDILSVKEKLDFVACDLDPAYRSTIAAEAFSKKHGLPLIKVQHHAAHLLSVIAENGFEGDAIGCCFDGTGMGEDKTIWGGEILLLKDRKIKRVSSITPFKNAGGDLTAREGWRVAVSMIYDIFEKDKNSALSWIKNHELCSEEEASAVFLLVDNKINTVGSTSVGRLFDAAAAILGIKKTSTFEGEAAMALQTEAERYIRAFGERETEKAIFQQTDLIPTDEIIDHLIRNADKDKGALSYYFHVALAEMTAEKIAGVSKETGVNTTALSGGTFQNILFLSLLTKRLRAAGLKVLTHSLIPANDGGIALGQAVFASGKYVLS